MRSAVLAATLASLCITVAAVAAPTVSLRLVGNGFSFPVEAVHANDGSTRLYVVEQGGRIRILQDGVILSTPFLDVSTGGIISTGGERGLLGMAFHPGYATNRAFYIFYTRAVDGAMVVARVLRSAGNPDVADPASRAEILVVPHPEESNHNGGKLAFGPDGYLHIATGDGGGGGDPFRAGQNLNDGRGKILRIAVDGGTGYAIPPTNPFASSNCASTDFCREIFHYGLRNPWRFSFDRAVGDLFIGDVGQNAVEEIDYLPAGAAGRNFGWGIFEGHNCYNNNYFGPSGACAGLANHTPPILTYGHSAQTGGFSVTGGFRYRGRKSAALRGYYIYGDYETKRVWAARPNGSGGWTNEVLLAPPGVVNGISGFAQDERGELYLLDHANGNVWAIDGPAPGAHVATDLDADARSDLLYRNADTGQVYRILVRGLSAERGAQVYLEPDTSWRIVGDADFNGDGVTDLAWRHATDGRVFVMLFGANGTPAGGNHVHAEPNAAWRIVQQPDIDGDGKADLLWRNDATGQVYAQLLDGASVKAQGFAYHEPDTQWAIVGAGDFAGDGTRNQVLWRHAGTGHVYLMTMGHNGAVFTTSGTMVFHEPNTAWRVVGVGDFDADGKSDILWRNVTTGQVYVMLMDNTTVRGGAVVYTEPNADWRIVATGDYNGDGGADILWRHQVSGQVFVTMLNGTARIAEGPLYREPNTAWRLLGPAEYAQ